VFSIGFYYIILYLFLFTNIECLEITIDKVNHIFLDVRAIYEEKYILIYKLGSCQMTHCSDAICSGSLNK
jgi:hypothetical protein